MSANDDLLGLGSLWDVESDNVALDESREAARAVRSTGHFVDAVRKRARAGAVSVHIDSVDRAVHVNRMGLNWVAGRLCGSRNDVVVPLNSIVTVVDDNGCSCDAAPIRVDEFVPLGAVLRRWERRASLVTAVTHRRGVVGRIVGVWRDAVELKSGTGVSIIPFSRLVAVVESDREWS